MLKSLVLTEDKFLLALEANTVTISKESEETNSMSFSVEDTETFAELINNFNDIIESI